MQDLPADCIGVIFSFLAAPDLRTARYVAKWAETAANAAAHADSSRYLLSGGGAIMCDGIHLIFVSKGTSGSYPLIYFGHGYHAATDFPDYWLPILQKHDRAAIKMALGRVLVPPTRYQ